MTAHEKALEKAKIHLMGSKDTTFFITICFSLKHAWDESIPTAQTNGLEIRFNPKFFLELSQEERVFLLLHETLHVAFDHITRRGDRDPRLWNIAADYVINLLLVKRGFQMPQGGLLDKRFDGMSTQEVYDQIKKEDRKSNLPWDDIQTPADASIQQAVQSTIDDILVRASVQAQMVGDTPGSIPGEIQLYINSLTEPKLPWHRVLRKYFTKADRRYHSFRKPRRRYFPEHLLPTKIGHALCDVAIAVDTSGSVSDEEFNQFCSETFAILKHLKPTSITFLQFDTSIRGEDKISSVQEMMKLKFTGRGGTNILPLMIWANTHKPHVLLVFTDGCFSQPQTPPEVPVIWLIHNNPNWTSPWGKVIHYSI